MDNGATGGIWLPFDIQEISRYWYTDRQQVRLSRIVSAQASLRETLFRHFFTLPEAITENYTALANALPADQPQTLLVYPPNQAQTVAPLVAAAHPNITVAPVGDAWPLDPQALDAELTKAVASATANHAPVQIAFLQETKGDPHRLIETWLNTHLFSLTQTYYGPVRLVSYAASGPVAQSLTLNARFGDAIQLDSLDVLDATPSPGGLVRLRLHWQALAPIADQYKVFTHIFAGDQILAQHDGQPVGELRPTNTWQVGESITDQFAIQLPPNAPAGSYQLRIGVYNLATQERLPMTLPDGSSGEFYVGGALTIH